MKVRTEVWGVGILLALLLALVTTTGVQAAAGNQVAPDDPPAPYTTYLPLAASGFKGSDFVEISAPADLAVIQESYTSTVQAVIYHEAYSVTGFSLVEQSPFGTSAPRIAADGTVTWLPGAAEAGIHRYTLSALVSDGSRVERAVTIEVAPRTWIISETVDSKGGTFGDLDGDYLVDIPANAVADGVASAQIGVSVVKRADGRVQLNRVFEGLRPDAEPTFAGPLYAVDAQDEPVAAAASCADLPFITVFNPDPLKWRGGLVHSAVYDWRPYSLIEQNVANVRLRGNVWMTYYPALPDRGMMELRGACKDQCLGKQPVLFVHGYSMFGSLGGGIGTWNCAFDYVKSLGGVPFEFRWRGNSRFEDVSYALAQAIGQVTQLTGRKPLVVGHSMGGIVITSYLAGLAEMPSADGQSYLPVGYDSAAARGGRRSAAVVGVVTISSPLSGIATSAEGATYNLPRGRDVHPSAATIEACNDFTCGESGYSRTMHTYPGFLVSQHKVEAFQALFGFALNAPGALIHRLYATWQAFAMPALHYDVLVSAWYTPGTPDWSDEDWGDGLIAVTGMQVLPTHFKGVDAQGQPYNYIRTAGRALTPAEKQRAGISADIDYTFMLTPSLTGGHYGYPHASTFETYVSAWWGFNPDPNAEAAALPAGGKLDYFGVFDHSAKPVLDRAYAAAIAASPVFTSLTPVELVMSGIVKEKVGSGDLAVPLGGAPLLVVFYDEGVYRGMVQTTTDAGGAFAFDLGTLLDDYSITDLNGLEVHVRVGNDTTHDAVSLVLDETQLDALTELGPFELLRR